MIQPGAGYVDRRATTSLDLPDSGMSCRWTRFDDGLLARRDRANRQPVLRICPGVYILDVEVALGQVVGSVDLDRVVPGDHDVCSFDVRADEGVLDLQHLFDKRVHVLTTPILPGSQGLETVASDEDPRVDVG